MGSIMMDERPQIGRTAQSVSAALLRTKSDPAIPAVRRSPMMSIVGNIRLVMLGTKLSFLLAAVPLAILAQTNGFSRPWVFALSLLGLVPLAERISFLTEEITYVTGPTVGGLLNATCGNATELIIALLALHRRKIHVVKYSLLGSILSNLLLVLGSSLFCGGLANLEKEQIFDRRQSDVNVLVLVLGFLCLFLPLMFRSAVAGSAANAVASSILHLSRASSIVMLVAYASYLFFQLKTHRQLFKSHEEEEGGNEEDVAEEKDTVGFWSAFTWLAVLTLVIALLSEYVVGTIEDASDSWGISVSFNSLILLPIVGNAAEHAGSVIFACKNKMDISLAVALGSASQILLFVVPVCVVVSWIMGIPMDLDFNLLETGSLALSIVVTAFALQDGTSHYMKGVVLCLCYAVIAACFFNHKVVLDESDGFMTMRVMPFYAEWNCRLVVPEFMSLISRITRLLI